MRGSAARRRRQPGRRGPDRRQHLPGDRLRARADPGHEQGRPARRRARARRPGDLRADRRGGRRPGPAHQRQDRRGRRGSAGGARRPRPAAQRRPRRGAPGADLRLRVRPVPRRDRVHPRGRRHLPQGRGDPRDGRRHRGRHRRHRLLHARRDARRGAARRRGRLPDHRHQGRQQPARRRHPHHQAYQGDRAAAGLPRGQADGVLRPVPDEQRRLPGAARRAREAHAQRRGAELGARDQRRARLRVPLRLPRAAAHGHRARAARARVRPRADGDDALGRVRDHAHRRRP